MAVKSAAALKAQFLGTDPNEQMTDIVDSAFAASSASAAGLVELATNAETQTGTDATRAVTPAGLAATTGTTTRAGVLELATTAEAQTGSDTARAVTPANVRSVLGGIKLLTFDGRNNVGAITLTGAAVGDIVLEVASLTEGALGGAAASFEAAITVVNQIQQSAVGDLSANNYIVLLLAVA